MPDNKIFFFSSFHVLYFVNRTCYFENFLNKIRYYDDTFLLNFEKQLRNIESVCYNIAS
jgi:hypothetical protein